MEHIKELITKMADDALIIGHRNSEWTGIGPILEEDIAFSSMAQDKIGHAQALYDMLHEHFNAQVPDEFAFHRGQQDFKCCHLVELPIGEYDFTIVRHFLFDQAEILRYELLQQSSFAPLASLAKKIHGELKYHVLHAKSWITRLGRSTDESHIRLQASLNAACPIALGIFEGGPFENQLAEEKIFPGEKFLAGQWHERISALLHAAHLQIPSADDVSMGMGGRNGYHTEYLQPLLNEMTEVYRMEENAEW